MKLFLEIWGYQETTREPYEGDEWDRGNTTTDWTIGKLRVTKPGEWGNWESTDVEADFKEGDTVFVVYAIYSTGDSFGSDDRARFELIDIYKDKAKAEEAKQMLADANTFGTLKLPSGMDYYVPWCGYFECLDELEILETVIEK